MKNIYSSRLCLAFIMLASTHLLQAQVADGSIFMQGNYVEIGINECGVYGSSDEPPVGPLGAYHGINMNGLGYIADHEKDGWDVSTEPGQPVFCGDYFTPGSPEEGWAIQVGDVVYENHSTYCNPYEGYWFGDSLPDMPGANVLYSDSAGVKTAVWEGTLEQDSLNLFIRQTTVLPDTALYFTSEIEITNNGTEDLFDIYYIRNVDPDQDLDNCMTFMTHNTIVSNTPASDTAFVEAVGGACGCYFGTITVDPRARVSYGAFFLSPYKPSDAYNGLEVYALEGDLLCDCAVQITFKFDLAAGETTTVSYARLFDAADAPAALIALENIEAPSITADGAAVSGDALTLCEGQSTALAVDGPDGYTWTWEPADYLDIATGTNVVSTPGTDITYTVTGTDGTNTVSASVAIAVSPAIDLEMSSTPGIDGTATGTATAFVMEGGIAPFTYLWSNGATTATISGLEPGAYIVWVTDAAGCEATAAVTVGLANNLFDFDAEKVFQVYPNPATSAVTIDLTAIAGLQNHLQITNMNGAMVWETANTNTQLIQIDVADWPAGIYLLQINNEAGSFIQRLTVD